MRNSHGSVCMFALSCGLAALLLSSLEAADAPDSDTPPTNSLKASTESIVPVAIEKLRNESRLESEQDMPAQRPEVPLAPEIPGSVATQALSADFYGPGGVSRSLLIQYRQQRAGHHQMNC